MKKNAYAYRAGDLVKVRVRYNLHVIGVLISNGDVNRGSRLGPSYKILADGHVIMLSSYSFFAVPHTSR